MKINKLFYWNQFAIFFSANKLVDKGKIASNRTLTIAESNDVFYVRQETKKCNSPKYVRLYTTKLQNIIYIFIVSRFINKRANYINYNGINTSVTYFTFLLLHCTTFHKYNLYFKLSAFRDLGLLLICSFDHTVYISIVCSQKWWAQMWPLKTSTSYNFLVRSSEALMMNPSSGCPVYHVSFAVVFW